MKKREEHSQSMEDMLKALRVRAQDPKLSEKARKNLNETAELLEQIATNFKNYPNSN